MHWKAWLGVIPLLSISCARIVRPPAQEPVVRVAIGLNEPEVEIGTPGALEVITASKVIQIEKDLSLRPGVELVVAGRNEPLSLPLRIRSRSGEVEVNNRTYRGMIEVQEGPEGFLILNIVPMEQYLLSVVPAELGRVGEESFEAAKAMAVAARSYALVRLDQNRNFDLYATVKDQLYPGKAAEADLTSRAVNATRGLVLTYNGKVAEVKYHSCCGGFTAAGSKVFNIKNLPYLRSQPDTPGHRKNRAPFCGGSPRFSWQRIYSTERFRAGLSEMVAQVYSLNSRPLVSKVRIKREPRTPRPAVLEIFTSLGRFEVSTTRARQFFGLPSDYFELTSRSDTVVLRGQGLGHGVGMCQWGALEMSRQGYNFKQILSHYYPGTRVERQYY